VFERPHPFRGMFVDSMSFISIASLQKRAVHADTTSEMFGTGEDATGSAGSGQMGGPCGASGMAGGGGDEAAAEEASFSLRGLTDGALGSVPASSGVCVCVCFYVCACACVLVRVRVLVFQI
jgi:hypothetical protein